MRAFSELRDPDMPKWPLNKKASPVLPLETIIVLSMSPVIAVILTASLRHNRVSERLRGITCPYLGISRPHSKVYPKNHSFLHLSKRPFAETEKAAICVAVKLKEAYFCNNRDNPRQRSNVSDALMYEVFHPVLFFRLYFLPVSDALFTSR